MIRMQNQGWIPVRNEAGGVLDGVGCFGGFRGWRDNGGTLCYCQFWEFDVRTATTFPESRAERGSRDANGGTQRRTYQKDYTGLAAAALAVCAGVILRLPGRAGDGAAVVDADMGPAAVLHNGAVRGIISGLGLLDIWIGISEAVHYRDYRG
jgi:hypothetical protein